MRKINIFIVGGGKGGQTLIEMLHKDKIINILGVADVDENAPGMRLARELGIPVSKDWRDFINLKDLDEIINVTGNKEVQRQLLEEKPQDVDVMGGPTAKVMWLLFEERKVAMRDLRQAKEYVELLFQVTPSAIFTVDLNRYVTNWNKKCEEITGFSREEVVGKECSLFAETPCNEKCGLFSDDVSKPVMAKECTIKSKDGHIIAISKNADILKDTDGKVIGGIESFEDITERKKQEEILKENHEALKKHVENLQKANNAIKLLYKEIDDKNKELIKRDTMRASFISQVSHELRTPLSAIKEGIAIVLDGSTGDINEDQKEFLDTADRNIDRLTRLINDILDLQKLEAGMMKFNIQKNDINETVREIHKTMEALMQSRGLELIIDLEEDIPEIEFDKDRITQVLTNLVNNAEKFTDKGSITIKTCKIENHVRVSVEDTGAGMKKEDIPKVFQRFEQLDTEAKRKVKGTGLGLAICKEIIERHEGKIWVESEYGEGSSFIFTIPIEKKYTILVIDDEKEFLSLCDDLLSQHGFNVLKADNGQEGIKKIRQVNPDLVVMDMRLPDINGYEILGRLWSERTFLDLPILAVSGYSHELEELDKIQSSQERSVIPRMVKPFDTMEFLKTIKDLIAKKKSK